jgi:hypothetical protein
MKARNALNQEEFEHADMFDTLRDKLVDGVFIETAV